MINSFDGVPPLPPFRGPFPAPVATRALALEDNSVIVKADGSLYVTKVLQAHPSIFNALINACCGISTFPNWRIFFFPAFCLSSSFRFRVASPP